MSGFPIKLPIKINQIRAHYNYRWFYALIISLAILFSGYSYDLSDHLHLLFALWKTEKNLSFRIIIHPVAKTYLPKNNKDIKPLLEIATLANKYAVSVEKIQILKSSLVAPDVQKIQLIVHGDNLHLADFVSALLHQAYPVLYSHFNYKENSAPKLTFNGELFVTSNAATEKMIDVKPVQHNPFCSGHLEPLKTEENGQSLSDSLNVIRMIGYVEQYPRKQALVMLSNHSILAVNMGMQLGIERGEVVEIQHNRIRLLLPNNKQFLLTM